MSRRKLRNTLGDYTAHHRLEETPEGGQILDDAADIQLAVATALDARNSSAWERAVDFRSAGDIRKLRTGEMVATITDLAILLALEPDAFVGVVDVLARLAGGRFVPEKRRAITLAHAVARTVRAAGELSALIHEYQAPTSDGGVRITSKELRALRAVQSDLKAAGADIDVQLAEVK